MQIRLSRQLFRDHQRDILRFWERARDNERGGFAHHIDVDGRVTWTGMRGLVCESRLLYNYAEGIRAGHGFCADHAAHLQRYLVGQMRGRQGFFFNVLDGKHLRDHAANIYANLFVVIGLGRYAGAVGCQQTRQIAVELLDLIETRAKMGEHAGDGLTGMVDLGVASEHGHRGWEPRGASGNVMLHYLEAVCVLHAAGVEGMETRVAGLRDFFYRYIYDVDHGITFDGFDGSYDRPVKRAGAHTSLGHGLEWIAFFRQFPAFSLERDTEEKIVRLAIEAGLLANGMMIDAYYLTERKCAGGCHFWPQVESVLTFHLLAPDFGEWVAEAFHRAAECYFERFVDPQGGVFTSLDPNGVVTDRDKADFWKLDYHSMRMCVQVIENRNGVLADE
jgi:mannose/cellobiose epimerase-like protein (N-acyl-D-glucosamine 2-epimerase family)